MSSPAFVAEAGVLLSLMGSALPHARVGATSVGVLMTVTVAGQTMPRPDSQARSSSPRVPGGTAAMPHLPGLDGLRALAVVAVVLYHLGLPWIPGGFLGVDVFFVLSGFLITAIVLQEVERDGRLSYRGFYLRRARRLLPALWLLLLTVSLYAMAFAPDELPELRGDVPAALLYVSNWWYVVADQSYFEFAGRPALLAHLWSLAVEEQFYLVWPVIVVALMAAAGRRRVRRVAIVGAVLSTAAMAVLAVLAEMPVPNDPSRVYYGTDTHAMGLLVGAALATAWAPWRRWRTAVSWLSPRCGRGRQLIGIVDLAGVVGLAGVAWFVLTVGEFSPGLYRGGFLALALLTAMVVAALAHPAGILGRVLATQPLRYLGERSYGIYLWHWPVFVLTRPGVDIDLTGWPATLLRVGVTLLLAEASYRLVERPVRRGAVGSALRRAREPGPQGRATARRLTAAALAIVMLVTVAAVGLARSPSAPQMSDRAPTLPVDQPPSDAQPRGIPTATDQPPEASAEPATVEPERTSAFGDSVLAGAAPLLTEAGVVVDAEEARPYRDVFDAVIRARDAGRLGGSVVVHAGNNSAMAESDLRAFVEGLDDRTVLMVNLHVPRGWEQHNNDLLERVAQDYAHVTVLDWHSVASDNASWLYDDGFHLTEPDGRRGYTEWLVANLGE